LGASARVPARGLEWWPAPAAPGTPPEYNLVGVRRFHLPAAGKPGAVLVLSPGFTAGINDLDYLAEELVRGCGERLQVWSTERRNHRLEDARGAELAETAGDPRLALGYYFAGDPPGHEPLAQASVPFMRHWGLATALADLRVVVRRAREVVGAQGRVLLGGHSMGGMLGQCYAAWEFPEGPGYREIDGLVLIDGAVGNPDWTRTTGLAQYEAGVAAIRDGAVYWDDPARGATPRFGMLAQVAALAAMLPEWREQPSLVAPLVPELLRLPAGVTVTNEAALGLVIDAETGPIESYLAHVGRLREGQWSVVSGQWSVRMGETPHDPGPATHDLRRTTNDCEAAPLGWIGFHEAGELTDLRRVARALRQYDGANGSEWYASRLLNAEIDLSSNLDSRHPDTVELASRHGLRLWHHGSEPLPVFGWVTGGSQQKRERYQWYAATVATEEVTIMDAPEQEHLDPLFAENDGRNRCLPSLTEWLLQRMAQERKP
jgi:pimeloyl-ACP methyl ester carboxylesterase